MILLSAHIYEKIKQEALYITHFSLKEQCDYCKHAHRTAAKAIGIASGDIEAMFEGSLPESDEHLKNLCRATTLLLERRGWLKEGDVEELDAMGISREKLYEIIALIGLKTITNYINHIELTEIDPQFSGQADQDRSYWCRVLERTFSIQ